LQYALTNRGIAVICGGTSSEREISMSSGAAIADALKKAGWKVEILDWAEKEIVYRCKELLEFDVVFIGYHGGAGEDGHVQAALELCDIPYTGSGPLASALAMDKIYSKRVFEQAGIPTARWFPWEGNTPPNAEQVRKSVGFDFPIVIKPAAEGSTVGVTIAKNTDELATGIEKARECGPRMLFEEYIPGREVTTAILEDVRLPVVEIIPEGGFYDYEHKYTKGASKYVAPAELAEEIADRLIDTGTKAFNLLGLKHYARLDFRLDGDNFYCLEANSLPGMTALSLVPMAARAVGIEFPELVDRIVRMAIK